MIEPPTPSLLPAPSPGAKRAAATVLVCSGVPVVVGLVTLLGWMLGDSRLTVLSSGLVNMKVNAALSVVLAGVALGTSTSQGWRRSLGRVCATLVLLVGLATLAEYLLGVNLGIDEVLRDDRTARYGTSHPGRMSPLGAIDLVLLSAALAVPRGRLASGTSLPQVAGLLVLLTSLVSLCGYLYGAPALYGVASFTHISPQTLFAVTALAIGLLASRPGEGIVGQLIRNDAGSVLVRRMLLASIAVPVLLGSIRLWGQRAGLYGTELGLALFASSNVVVFVWLIYRSAIALSEHHSSRLQAEGALKETNEVLETRTRVAEALKRGEERYRNLARNMPNAAMLMFDQDLRFLMAEGALLAALGQSPETLIGKTLSEVGSPASRAAVEQVYRATLAGVSGSLDVPSPGRWVRLHTAPVYDAAGLVTHGMVFFYDMTAFAKTAEVVRESEARLRGLAEAAFEGIAIVDQGVVIDANSALATMFGRARDQLVRSSWADLVAPSDREGAVSHIRSGSVEARESIGLRASGEHFPIEVRARRLHREGIDLDAVAIQDLSARRRAESARQRADEQFRRLVEALPQGIIVIRDERYGYANPSAATILGFESPAAMAGKSIWDAMHPDEVRGRTLPGARGPRRGPLGQKVIRCLKCDGSEILLSTISLPIDLEDGAGILLIFDDITRQREIESAARATAARWRSILDGAEHSIIATTPEGIIVEFNPAAERMLGYRASEVVGRVTPEIVHEMTEVVARAGALSSELGVAVEPGFEALVAKARRRQPDHNEWTYIRKDGSRLPVRLSVTALLGPEGEVDGFLGIASDITEAKRAEAELIKARDAAEGAMRARSDFLARMSHEIRTPMNGILGMTELALQTRLTGEQRDYIETAESSARTLLSLINDILDFSKIDSGKLRLDAVSFSPERAFGAALRPLTVLAQRKGLELLLEVRPDVPKGLLGDPQRLAQIVTNLVGNAIKFTDRGDIVVSLRVAACRGETVDLEIEVRDDGIGIQADKQAAIFEAFSQVDEATTRHFGGTGLGLAICAQLVALMGGKISVQSELERGSRFLVCVPLQQDRQAVATRPTGDLLRGLRVLLLDDHPAQRALVETMLRSWQVEVVPADVYGAIDVARDSGAGGKPVGLVIVNAAAARADGGGFVGRLMGECASGAGLVLLGGREGAGEDEITSTLGPHALVTKPVLASALLEAMEALLTGGSMPGAPPPTPWPLPVPASEALRILVADDSAVNRKIVCTMLEKVGHLVEAVNDGLATVAAVERGGFDLVLMDVEMPLMDGFKATRAIRDSGNSIPIVALTAQAMKGDQERCLAAGMDTYLSKPINRELLLQTVVEVARSRGREPASRGGDAPVTAPAVRPSPFNQQELLARVEGDLILLAELVRLFRQDTPVLLELARTATAAGDAREVERAAHTLSGILLNMSAPMAAAAARSLEERARASNLDQAPVMIAQLEAEIRLVEGSFG